MKICVGSENPSKINAVHDILYDYKIFKTAEVIGVSVKSGVSDQPMTLNETVDGAINRAKNAFKGCDFSIGLESGLMTVVGTKSGFMNMTVCAIFNGKNIALGLSAPYEIPYKIIKLIKSGMELQDAVREAGFTNEDKIGSTGGIISVFSDGLIYRKDFSTQAIRNAMIHLQHPEIFI